MFFDLAAVRITCDCAREERHEEACHESVVGYGRTLGEARAEAVQLAYWADWTLLTRRPGQRGPIAYAPGHRVQTEPGVWVKPVSLVKSYV